MKKILFLITVVMMPFMVSSCENDNAFSDNNALQTITLSEDETRVYNAVKNTLSAFKNPGSVIVVAVSEKPYIGYNYVKISAQNSFGGYSTSIYQVSGNGLREVEDDITFHTDYNISVSNINAKLNEYKKTMGWA